MSRQTTIEEFTDYVDNSLEKLKEQGSCSIYTFVNEIASLIRMFTIRRKYLGISIEGYQGTGKTTLALLIAKEYYGSWKTAFNSIRFSIKDFIKESLELVETGYDRRIAIRILDDFAFQGGSKWKRERDLIDLLEYMNVIRTMYTSLIFTYVDDSGARFIRDNAKLKLIMNMKDLETVEVRVYTRRYSTMGVTWKRVLTIDWKPGEIHSDPEFQELYNEYWKKRKEAVKEKGKALLEGLDTKKRRLFDVCLGYFICKQGYPWREVPDIIRKVEDLEFRNETFYSIKRLVKKKLIEYNIIEDSGSGEQD